MDLSTALRLTVTATATKTADMSGTPTSTSQFSLSDSLADGTSTDQADIVYFDANTLVAAASQSYDLAGSLSDVFGDIIAAVRVKFIGLKNTSSTASVLLLGGGTGGDGTNAFDSWISSTGGGTDSLAPGCEGVFVRAGGIFALWAPDSTAYAVAAGTADILIVSEQSTLAAAYDLMLIMSTA